MDIMKLNIKNIIISLLLAAALLFSGCNFLIQQEATVPVSKSNETQASVAPEQEVVQPTPEAGAGITDSPIVGDVRPAPQTSAVRQPVTREGASETPLIFDKNVEWDMLSLDSYKLSRTSSDKGIVEEVTFTVRNTGSKPLTPRVTLWFRAQEVGGDADIPDILEKVYDLPSLEPGYKITKTYPANFRFHYLDRQKKFSLMLRDRFSSPPRTIYQTDKTFMPIEEMENLEISWT